MTMRGGAILLATDKLVSELVDERRGAQACVF
jgi:hypothetical protein